MTPVSAEGILVQGRLIQPRFIVVNGAVQRRETIYVIGEIIGAVTDGGLLYKADILFCIQKMPFPGRVADAVAGIQFYNRFLSRLSFLGGAQDEANGSPCPIRPGGRRV